MRTSVFLLALACASAGAALAQAPVEERSPRRDGFREAQQRVEFARENGQQAEQRVRDAQERAKEADETLGAARRQYEEAQSRSEQAQKEFAQARARAAEWRTTYEKEAADLERVRRARPAPGDKK